MKRVVVTGGSGLLGSYVVRALREDTEVVALDLMTPKEDVRFFHASILDRQRLLNAFRGADAVAHIAAAPNIGSGSPERIFDLNVRGTWNVLEAARLAGVRRVVLCSSDSVMGNTVWKEFFWCPEYLPVDENHALRPADPYGLSKLLGEEAGRSYSRRGVEVVALRPVFILFPKMMGEVRARHSDPDGYVGPCAGGQAPAGGGLCWHHIDPRDVANAFRLALIAPWHGFAAYYLTAPSTLHVEPTLDRIRTVFGRLPDHLDRTSYIANPFAPMFSTARAEADLKWTARHDHRFDVMREAVRVKAR